jgi:hypothetical protein
MYITNKYKGTWGRYFINARVVSSFGLDGCCQRMPAPNSECRYPPIPPPYLELRIFWSTKTECLRKVQWMVVQMAQFD